MQNAKTRKSTAIQFVSRHLISAAYQALSTTRQTAVAKLLNVADSTILRRAEKYPEIMETLAACGVEDFVMKGEKKLPMEQYRYLMTVAMEFAKYQLAVTEDNALAA